MSNSQHGNQAPVVQKGDNAIHRINLYPLDSAIGFPNTYPLDSDLSSGYRYPSFEQLGPESDLFTSALIWNRLCKTNYNQEPHLNPSYSSGTFRSSRRNRFVVSQPWHYNNHWCSVKWVCEVNMLQSERQGPI